MPPTVPLLPQLYITVGGADVPGDLSQDIASVEVDMHLYLPDMFVIQVHDDEFRWVEHSLVKIGQLVKIAARASEDEQKPSAVLLSGEIVSIECRYPESGVPTLLLRGYDLSHRLHRGRKVRSFMQATDSDIAEKVARERGLKPEVDKTKHVYEHLFQENLTDFEFLARRARAVGFVFSVDERKLIFKKPASVALAPIELDYRETLLDFRPRVSASAQVNNVTVRGWDPTTKRPIVGRSRAADYRTAKLGWEKRGNEYAKQAFGETETAFSDEPIASQSEGDSYAHAHLSRAWSTDVQAEGEATGNPKIRAGVVVKIKGVGERFGGDYFVTSVRHTFEANGQFRTLFTVGGYGSDTTADLLFPDATRIEQQANSVARGLAIGIVTDNKDEKNLGRVKVKFPWLAGDTESNWARLASPMAGKDRGFFYLPEVNDEVVVAFEHGDFNRPYILGALWNGEDKPPLTSAQAAAKGVVKRIIKTRAGHILQFDDTEGSEKIEVIDKTGKNKIVIESASNKITIESTADIEIKGGTSISLSAPQVKIDGKQKVTISGAEIESSASARHKIAGGIVEIN